MRRLAAASAALWLVPGFLACGTVVPEVDPSGFVAEPVADAPQRGPADAWVTVIEFADFECAYCREEAPVVDRLVSAYPKDLRVAFKHLPLTMLHAHAQAAAVAAECAREQGKFWELADLLFRSALDDAAILADAGNVAGLDVASWKECLASDRPAGRISADVAAAYKAGIRGTPAFVINGAIYVGALPEAVLRNIIEEARDVAKSSGIPQADYYRKAILGGE